MTQPHGKNASMNDGKKNRSEDGAPPPKPELGVISDKAFTTPHAAAGIASAFGGNLLQPWAPVVWIALALFGAAIVIALFLILWVKKPKKGLLGFGVMGFLISGFLIAAQFAPQPEENRELTREVGALAANVPGLIGLQNAVLPISERDKALNAFRRAILQGDEDARGLAARTAIDESEDASARGALIAIALRSETAAVRQAGLVNALSDRKDVWLALTLASEPEAPGLRAVLQGSRFRMHSIDKNSGGVRASLECSGGASRQAAGLVASGRLSLTASCRPQSGRGWASVQIDLAPDATLKFSGTAIVDADKLNVSAPLL
jgi:hypothetical protein